MTLCTFVDWELTCVSSCLSFEGFLRLGVRYLQLEYIIIIIIIIVVIIVVVVIIININLFKVDR